MGLGKKASASYFVFAGPSCHSKHSDGHQIVVETLVLKPSSS